MASGGQTMFAQMHSREERLLLFRLQILICDGGLQVLRNILDQTLTAQGLTLRACLDSEKSTITRLKSRGVITQTQYDILFPASGQSPTTTDMDITLVICLLRSLKCFGLNKKFDWNASPTPTDLTVEADICRLRTFRNKVSHISTAGIQRNDFLSMWNEIEQILVRRSSPAMNIHQMIANFKCCPLDLEEDIRIQKELNEWKDYEAEVGHLKDEMTDIKTDVSRMMKHLEQIKRRQYSIF
ncbi:uncharacterized protein LOC132724410 [Ruditapes philippinarum]|uniref:uncharacterized protein LOC132724410 n=1 Tax=Ruditapes philippinarum TaxID=129788 RepID=UPI00295AC428|nr:uncharacterized protein LOC132724410 [Ruditapes philippinarum]